MKMHVPLSKPEPWVLPVTVVCLALGMLIASMLNISRSAEGTDPNSLSRETLVYIYAQEKREKEQIEQELVKLREDYDRMIDNLASDQKMRQDLQRVIDELRIRAGSTEVEGPGIVIVLDDSKQMQNNPAEVSANPLLTHDVDLLQLVNELRNAGAVAIAINDQRVAGSTAIRCVGSVININDRPVSAPFVVRAVGKPDVLSGAANLPYGILDQLRQMNIAIEVSKREKVRVPALTVQPPVDAGKSVPAEKKSTKPDKGA